MVIIDDWLIASKENVCLITSDISIPYNSTLLNSISCSSLLLTLFVIILLWFVLILIFDVISLLPCTLLLFRPGFYE